MNNYAIVTLSNQPVIRLRSVGGSNESIAKILEPSDTLLLEYLEATINNLA